MSISFFGSAADKGSSDSLKNCTVNYTRSTATLSTLLECPFTILPGTYIGAAIGLKNSFDVLIDDQVNGIFTDPASPTKLSGTRPAGGAQFVTYSVTTSAGQNNVIGSEIFFRQPVVIDSGAMMPVVSVVADLIHSVFVTVNANGTMSFFTDLPIAPVYLTPSVEGVSRAEFYTSSGTAFNACMNGATDADANSVRIVYTGTQPSTINSPVVGPSTAYAANPEKSFVLAENGIRAGGYLGLDASGMMCWALPVAFDYKAYNYLRRMQPVTALGQGTILQTMNLNGGQAPKPTSGDTYASGCPSSFVSNSAVTVYLVAK